MLLVIFIEKTAIFTEVYIKMTFSLSLSLYPPPCLRHRLACGFPSGCCTSDPAGILCRNSRRAWEVTETVTFPKNCH